MVKKQSQNYYKLNPEDISVNVSQNKNGNTILTIGLYEKAGWKQHIKIELVDFPDCCSGIDNFKSLTIRGIQSPSVDSSRLFQAGMT
jgi:hypothetical protein